MREPDPLAMAAVCGLWCGACSLRLAGEAGGAPLEALAGRLGQTPEETRCGGCRSDQLSTHCRSCGFRDCAAERGHAFCAECAAFPCDRLAAFQGERPHRLDLWRDAGRIREIGGEAWLAEIPARYRCPACGTLSSAYEPACPVCSHAPAHAYGAEHGETVKAFLARR